MVDVLVENLNLWFGNAHILKNIRLDIYDNKVTALIGPSGCGKSTLIRCFNRMNDFIENVKIEGRILIDNEDIYNEKSDVFDLRSRVGMVFQKPNPFPKSIYENLVYGLKIKGIKKKSVLEERAEKSLKQAGLWIEVKDRLHSSAFSLSGGQQQRLCIARALATEPEILLLDEPTSALDPKSSNKIEELLLELKNSVTIIIVTHNFSQAGRVSDYTAFLYLGEIVEYGKTDKLFTVPKDKRTEEFLTGRFG
ncbi:MAG: phosphate ABC transporter ATP-binding protein [Spirochaetes bacterium]|nr:phosphate ABC transporter ATP-binding protein [Spirochaetota bacterium]